jgi:hypothetical protein
MFWTISIRDFLGLRRRDRLPELEALYTQGLQLGTRYTEQSYMTIFDL